MSFTFRVLIGSFLLFLGIAGVSYMQNRFDKGDEKKALEAVLIKHPELENQCSTSIISRVRGIVQVDCGATKVWVVDILKGEMREGREAP